MKLIADPFVCPDNPESLDEFRSSVKESLRSVIGVAPFDTAPPLNPRTHYTTDGPGYIRKKVRYGNVSDDVVWAWLLIPKGKASPGDGYLRSSDNRAARRLDRCPDRRPAIICMPGSFMTPNYGKDGPAGLAGPLDANHPEAYGKDLAGLGYITLCPDYPAAGERTSPGLKAYDTSTLDKRFPAWSRVGMSAWDISRAVDFLLTVDEVDPARIGITGWSQGGEMSVIGAALDERIRVTVSVCGWAPFRNRNSDVVENLVQSYNYPRLRKPAATGSPLSFDMDHVAACIAPRPFLDIRGTADRFFPNKEDQHQASVQLARLYEMLDAGSRYRDYWFDGEHGHPPDAARESQAWFYRWLWQTDPSL